FGYRPAVNGVVQSPTLQSSGGQGCNRWGWYTTPTLARLQSGITGQILTGAGNNNLNAATNVGTFTAKALGTGVTVTYNLTGPYRLSEVHADQRCLPITTCAPGQYTFGASGLANVQTYSNTNALPFPTCSGGARPYLIVHAVVRELKNVPC
ncbi:hypothetical protein QBC39DRAFT_265936, partial [Podospora conica]